MANSKRFVLSASALIIGSVMLYAGHMNGEQWVYVVGVVLAGHNAEDIVKVARKR